MTRDLETLKRERPIAAVVTNHGVALQGRGARLIGRCPFHADSVPSFTVYPETGRFYCFGCGASGDVIDFVRRAEGIGFREALSLLETPAPRPLRRTQPPTVRPPSRLSLDDRLIVAAAFELYQEQLLASEVALRYLRERGVSESLARRQRLGYAAGDGLVAYLGRRRLSVRHARELGLVTAGGGEALAGRVIVPELRGGRSTWLVGRALDDDVQPKYRGLALPRPLLGWEQVRDRGRVFVTEGPFDWLTLVDWGLPACALLGTRAGTDTLRLLERARRVVLALDVDEAGVTAAAELAARLGDRALTLSLPPGVKDVNALATQPDGRATFFRLLDEAAQAERQAVS